MSSEEDEGNRGPETRLGRKRSAKAKLFVQFQGSITTIQVLRTDYYQMICISRKRSSVSERNRAKTEIFSLFQAWRRLRRFIGVLSAISSISAKNRVKEVGNVI